MYISLSANFLILLATLTQVQCAHMLTPEEYEAQALPVSTESLPSSSPRGHFRTVSSMIPESQAAATPIASVQWRRVNHLSAREQEARAPRGTPISTSASALLWDTKLDILFAER